MMIDQAELGLRLKRARKSCGLTQEDVAQEMAMVRATIAQIELGNRSVSGLAPLAWRVVNRGHCASVSQKTPHGAAWSRSLKGE